ncbi:type IV toxin-antitoxin system AbiEi family antitoxin [bacterium]|nr:type IV toxin-antitoxin system AbiEi family antitoxin [bacterium]
MTRHISSKLNLLLRHWPRGTVAVSSWLEERGIYRQLLDTYQKSNWTERVGYGAFVRAGDTVDWTGALYAMQYQLNLPIHVGGKTALEVSGYAQNIPLGEGRSIFFFGSTGQRLPKWFDKHNWKVNILYTTTKLFQSHQKIGLTTIPIGDYHITLSSPERAIMEALYFVRESKSFEEAASFMENLTAATLRPKLVQRLLEGCNSVKVKRLFMYLSELNNFEWVKKIDLAKVDFGKGKRLIVKNGHYDAKYRITVPASPKYEVEG